jgi:hypothetical protein
MVAGQVLLDDVLEGPDPILPDLLEVVVAGLERFATSILSVRRYARPRSESGTTKIYPSDTLPFRTSVLIGERARAGTRLKVQAKAKLDLKRPTCSDFYSIARLGFIQRAGSFWSGFWRPVLRAGKRSAVRSRPGLRVYFSD